MSIISNSNDHKVKYAHQAKCKESIDNFMNNPAKLEATTHMFCGTGKSKVEIDTLRKHVKNLAILLVSSLALKDQFQESYFSQLKEEFDIIYVNSDYGGITDLSEIEQRLQSYCHKKKIVVCLYQSFHTLNKVLFGKEKFQVDFLIADESHYLDDSKEGKKILKEMKKYERVKKLYFSATPSDNQKDNVIYRYGYLDGVQDDILQPFEIYLQYSILDSTVRDVPHDGNCFFHCLAHYLNKSHTEIRKECIDFYLEKSDSELASSGADRSKIADLYQDGIWNTNEFDCLPKIASELYQRTITVFREDQMAKDTFEIPKCEEQIHLRLKDSHYDIMEYKEHSEKETALEYFRFMVRNYLLTGNNKIMCFHNGVEESNVASLIPVKTMEKYKKDFQAIMDELSFHTKKVRWEGFAGNVETRDRTKVLEDFKNHDDPNCLFILSSCMTLREGVDTSEANAIMWVDPKKNYRVVIQNLGRIVRKGNKIQNGSVIVPITIDKYTYERCSTKEQATNLLRDEMNSKNGNFNPIIYFLDSLRINDPDIAIQLENYPPSSNTRRKSRKHGGNSDEESDSESSIVVDESDLESAVGDEQSDSEYDFENEKSDTESSIEDEQSDSDDSYLATEGSVLDSGSEDDNSWSEDDNGSDDESSLEDKNRTTNRRNKKRRLKIRIHFPEGYNIHLGEIFSQSLCATLEHSVNSSKFTPQQKVDILVDFANQNERTPTEKDIVDDVNLATFWENIKYGANANLLPQCLERSEILRKAYEKYLKEKEDAKTPQEKVDMLVDFANENKRHPTYRESIDGVNLGRFWNKMKGGQNANLLPQCLERSTWLKDDYERYLKEKESTPQEKVDMLVDFANEKKRHPKRRESIDDVNLGQFWNNMKGGQNANLLPQCIERNTWLKDDYERYLKEKESTPQEKVDMLVDFANEKKRHPKRSESIDDVKIGRFWEKMKGGQNANLLPQCLERSTWLKDDYERYLKEKEHAKTPQQKADMLVDFANQNERTPTEKDIVDDVNLGQFWNNMKGGQNANLLPQCIERNTWLKDDYERYLKEKESTPQEKVDMLVDFANEKKRHPKRSESIDGFKIDRFWDNMKGGHNANLLPQCLERSTWLKDDYEEYCERQKKKGKSIKKVLVKTARKPRVARNVALHRKVQESSASGIYNDQDPPHLEDKNYINETLANHIPPEGKIIVLDGTNFRTSRKLNQPERTTIVQFNDEHYNEMIDDETFGDCLVYDQLATHLEKVNEPIGMVYADICGSWKEMQPILEVLSKKEFVENAIVACTTCARDGERKTEEGLDFVSWLMEEMNERLEGKWKLIGKRSRIKYGNMCTRMIRRVAN